MGIEAQVFNLGFYLGLLFCDFILALCIAGIYIFKADKMSEFIVENKLSYAFWKWKEIKKINKKIKKQR